MTFHPALPAGVPALCDDRVNHGYVGNCSSNLSAPPNQHWLRRACPYTGATNPHAAGVAHQTCGRCYDNSHGQAWLAGPAGAVASMTTVGPTNPWPPMVPGGPNAAMFPEFWTRLCSVCEQQEQERREPDLMLYALNGNTVNQPANAVQMWHWPHSTCTCRKLLGGPGHLPPAGPVLAIRDGPHPGAPPPTNPSQRFCQAHLQNQFNELNTIKEANCDWLRTVSRSGDGKLCMAGQTTLNHRDADLSYRACRCGANVDTMAFPPEVVMCMACEGTWVMVRRGLGSRYGVRRRSGRKVPRRDAEIRSKPRGQGDQSLQRVREDFPDVLSH